MITITGHIFTDVFPMETAFGRKSFEGNEKKYGLPIGTEISKCLRKGWKKSDWLSLITQWIYI